MSSYSQAQSPDSTSDSSKTFFWAAAGMGGSPSGMTFGFSYNYHHGKTLYSLRMIRNVELTLFMPVGPPSPLETISDFSILYGRAGWSSKSFTAIAIGVGLVYDVRRTETWDSESGEYETVTHLAPGIAAEAQAAIRPFPGLGFSMLWFGNLNPRESYVGMLLAIQVGNIR